MDNYKYISIIEDDDVTHDIDWEYYFTLSDDGELNSIGVNPDKEVCYDYDIGNYNKPRLYTLDTPVINVQNIFPDREIKSIGPWCFSNCPNIKTIAIPDSVIYLSEKIFYGCSGLVNVHLGQNSTFIGTMAFRNCTSLTEILLPKRLETIDTNCFAGCSKLTTVHIYPTLREIRDRAFFNTPLTWDSIPDTVTELGCIFYNGESEYVIDDRVTSIGESCFRYCTNLTSISIPDRITSLGEYAFANCTKLTSIELSTTLTDISSYAFMSCSTLTDIDIPSTVETIGSNCFHNCSKLTDINIYKSANSIDGSPWGCSSANINWMR